MQTTFHMQTWILYFTIITEFRICRKILDDQHMFVTTFFCAFVYVCRPKANLIFKGNSPIMFKYSSILNIITYRIILMIIYMCFEFQMEQKSCIRRLIYDLVNLFLFYISTHDVCFAAYYFAAV